MDQEGAVRTGTRRGSNPLEAVRIVPTRLDASRNGHCQGGKHDVKAGRDSPSIPNVAATIARGLGPVKLQTKKIGANRPRCVEIFCSEKAYVDFSLFKQRARLPSSHTDAPVRFCRSFHSRSSDRSAEPSSFHRRTAQTPNRGGRTVRPRCPG